jgi:hypothetical protein
MNFNFCNTYENLRNNKGKNTRITVTNAKKKKNEKKRTQRSLRSTFIYVNKDIEKKHF